jgi:hypothetical protein
MSITVHASGGVSVTGPESIEVYRLIVLKHALALYAKTGMRPNRRITPTAMLQMASEVTGKKYKRGQHEQAAYDIAYVLGAKE